MKTILVVSLFEALLLLTSLFISPLSIRAGARIVRMIIEPNRISDPAS
ncbi:MAG TPA: hypothetical protein PK627_15625 [Bacteroidales bacterium]|nr:hypothetical protein [Bacteroidales bacterium]